MSSVARSTSGMSHEDAASDSSSAAAAAAATARSANSSSGGSCNGCSAAPCCVSPLARVLQVHEEQIELVRNGWAGQGGGCSSDVQVQYECTLSIMYRTNLGAWRQVCSGAYPC